MKRKKWMIGIIVLILSLFIIDIVAGVYFYKLAIERGPKDFLQGNADLEVSAETMDVFLEGDWISWTETQDFETKEMTSFDGLNLAGYYLPAKVPTNKAVIFAHGYLGNAFDMGLFAEYYYEELGYNIFTPDLRGHGASEGNYYGFGWHDRLDLRDWIDQVIAWNGEDTEIVLHGLSMGGAAVLMTSGEDLPANVKAVIADSAYTSVYDLFAYLMERMYKLPDQPVLPTTSLVTNLMANYSFIEASALNQVQQTNLPILYIAGEEDTFVPANMTQQLYENTKNGIIKTFPGANHGESIVMHRAEYETTIKAFLEQNMGVE